MEIFSYIYIDRVAKGWHSGLWDDEPDKVQWPDQATGLPCLALRHPFNGGWCGYVGVPPGHPDHGTDANYTAHCGTNYFAPCMENAEEHNGICHLAEPGEPEDIWWIGFDCNHMHDWTPLKEKELCQGTYMKRPANTHYRTLAYVQAICAQLAQDLMTAEQSAA